MVKACFDYGHGGKDPGAIGNGMYEKDVVFSIGRKCKEIVERHGVQVVETRSGDTYLSLTERANISNKNNCDILVSFHTNAFTNSNARGFEIWTSKGQTKGDVLATRIGEQIKKDFPNVPFRADYSDGDLDKEENFTVIAKAKAPACLIEMGFITNKEDAQIIKTQQDKIAESIAKGILSYFGIKYQEPKKEEPKQQKESGKLYKVQVGAFSKRENAEKLLKELKKKGYDAIVVADKTDSQNKDVIQLEYKGAVKKGTKGEHVKELQKALKLLGYYKDAIDGSAGPNTVAAIKAFQKANGLTVDGSAGPATYAKLNEVLRRL